MNFKRSICLASLLAICGISAVNAVSSQRGFAIVVDPKSYAEAKNEISAYAQSVENSGLKTVTVIDKWGIPDSIRAELKKLYNDKKNPIEGVVFIGDIPIPMIRDAQHLTSAFKMNQEAYPREESSVPSDRFYDDFDLKFKYLDHDTANVLYHYYSLLPESPQYLRPEIYSGRIKPIEDGKSNKYDLLRRYLKKVVRQKNTPNIVDKYLYFSGHGYVSESMMARIDEKGAILQNFPWMQQQASGIDYIDHKRDKAVKTRLMSELQRKDLDIALLHHHGDAEIEYLNNLPDPKSIPEAIDLVKMYLREVARNHVKKGLNPDSVMHRISKNLSNVPLAWFDGAFNAEVTKKDSIYNRELDLYVDDFGRFTPNSRMVILDACFNGSFHKSKYIAGAYIFDEGETAVVLANSVNVLQDKWTDRYVGMMGLGMKSGYMVQYNPYLESHVFGDPTYTFTPAVEIFDVNEAIASKPASWWKKQLNSAYPAVQVMALRKLVDAHILDSKAVLDIYKNNKSEVVRLECLVLLSQFDDDNFVKCLDMAVDDSYEMVQRFAVNFIAKRGDESLARALVSLAVRNNTAERTEFAVKQAAALYPEEILISEFDKQFDPSNFVDGEKVGVAIKDALKIYANSFRVKDVENIMSNDTALTVPKKLNAIRTIRNSHMHYFVPQLLVYVENCDDAGIQVALLEAFGWFKNSFRHKEISEVALRMSKNATLPQQVRDEALKTYNRIEGNRL